MDEGVKSKNVYVLLLLLYNHLSQRKSRLLERRARRRHFAIIRSTCAKRGVPLLCQHDREDVFVCMCVHVCLFSLRNPRRYNVIRIIQGNIGLPWRFKYFSRSIGSFLVFYFSFVAFFFWFSLTHRYTR